MASQVTDVVGHHRTNPERRELLGTHRSQDAATRTRNAARSSPWPWVARARGRLDVERQGKLCRQAGRDQRVAGNRLDQVSRQGGLVRVIWPCPSTSTSFECEPGQTKTRPSWPGSSRPQRVSSAGLPGSRTPPRADGRCASSRRGRRRQAFEIPARDESAAARSLNEYEPPRYCGPRRKAGDASM